MGQAMSIPRYDGDLPCFLGDLRSLVFSSQSKMAHYLGLSHSTVSRYENGRLTPPSGYILLLAHLVSQRLLELGLAPSDIYPILLQDVNTILRWGYADQPPVADWPALYAAANDYLVAQIGKPIAAPSPTPQNIDWGEAPDVSIFWGRQAELGQLQEWVLAEACRLVVVVGMGGVGKTALVTKFMAEAQPHFDHIVWRSLRNAPYAQDLIPDIAQCFAPQSLGEHPLHLDDHLGELVKFFQAHRCLLVLDNVESIIRAGDVTGQYREGYEAYATFWEKMATIQHQSCLILTSREKPVQWRQLETLSGLVKSYQLSGLTVEEGRHVLRPYQLQGPETAWQTLMQQYSGNPLALKLVAETIREMFASDLERFLKSESVIFGDVRQVLDQQLSRLPPLALSVLYWLAVEREPRTIEALQAVLSPPPRLSSVIEAVQSLQRRSLVEMKGDAFFLQNVVAEFTMEHLIHEVCQALTEKRLGVLRKVALIKATAKEYVRRTQVRLILEPVARMVTSQLGVRATAAVLRTLLDQLQAQLPIRPGYAAGNLLNLQLHLGCDVSHASYARLPVWQAYLRDVTLAHVDFTEADLSHSVFDNAFVGVNYVAMSPDGVLLAVATGQEVWLWHLPSRQLYQVLQGHTDLVWSLAFSRDGQFLFSSGQDRRICRWRVATGEMMLHIHTGTHRIWSMAAHPDGSLIATGGHDGEVYLWDGETGKVAQLMIGHQADVRAVAFAPTGAYVAAGGQNCEVRVWQVANGRLAATFTDHTKPITALTFTPDSYTLISGSRDHTIRLWNLKNQQPTAVLSGHTHTISDLRCHPDGSLLVSSSYDRTVRVWRLPDQEPIYILSGHTQSVGSIALNQAGTVLASGSYDRTVRLWDLTNGQLLDVIEGKTFRVFTLAFSSDERFLASGNADYGVRVWDLAAQQRLFHLKGHRRWVSAVVFHPHDPLLASASYDRTIRLWDVQAGRVRRVLADHAYWVLAVAFSPDGQVLASGSTDQTVKVWHPFSGELIQTLTGHTSGVNCVAFSPDNRLLASGDDDGVVRLWQWETGRLVQVFAQQETAVTQLTFNQDGSLLMVIDAQQRLSLWQVATGVGQASPFGETAGRLTAVHPTMQHLSVNEAGTRITHQTTAPSQTTTFAYPQTTDVTALAFSPPGQMFASGDLNGTIDVWHMETQKHYSLQAGRPYEGMDITDVTGLTPPQIEMLQLLGAVTAHN